MKSWHSKFRRLKPSELRALPKALLIHIEVILTWHVAVRLSRAASIAGRLRFFMLQHFDNCFGFCVQG